MKVAVYVTVLVTAAEYPSIRVSSYEGSTLSVGECSGLTISPSGAEYTVTSSDPDIAVVERVLTVWVTVAKVCREL